VPQVSLIQSMNHCGPAIAYTRLIATYLDNGLGLLDRESLHGVPLH
jgi:hypothetical protein